MMTDLTNLTKGLVIVGLCSLSTLTYAASTLTYPIVDTNQNQCSDLTQNIDTCPIPGDRTYGQDAQYQGLSPSYTDNGDGTITDNNTGLMWAKTTDTNGDGKINVEDKLSYDEGQKYASELTLAGHSDWRVPTIKEQYSLMLFDGQDPSGMNGAGDYSLTTFIDLDYFDFNSGDMEAGERLIDSQYLSSTKYVSTTMRGDETIFGVNFIDGRIKGYGATSPRDGGDKSFYLLVVRGAPTYGVNHFDNPTNGTVKDQATGLTWQQNDSQYGMDFSSALSYCENLTLNGNSNWRLPNVKELQSIVDYTKSPQTHGTASISSEFIASEIVNEAGEKDYGNYWSSTTHTNLKNAKFGAYVSFGRAMGYMNGQWMDVHGAGAQRSDPKQGDASQYPTGNGPQGDSIRIDNMVRCVTGGEVQMGEVTPASERTQFQFTLTGSETGTMDGPNGNSQNSQSKGQDSRPSMKGPKGGNPFTHLDSNNDGKLSKQEVRGPLANDFDQLDRNGDGFITEDEMPKKPR